MSDDIRVSEMEGLKIEKSIKSLCKKMQLSTKGFGIELTNSFSDSYSNMIFRLKHMSNTRKMKNMAGIDFSAIAKSDTMKDIIKSDGVFTRYKHFAQLETLVQFLNTMKSNDFIETVGMKNMEVARACIETFNLLATHRATTASNVLYFRELKGNVPDAELVSFSGYIMAVLSLTYTIANVVKVAVISLNEDPHPLRKFKGFLDSIEAYPFYEQLNTFNTLVKTGAYPKHVKNCIKAFERTGSITTGLMEDNAADMEDIGTILVVGVASVFITSLVLVLTQAIVFFVYFTRGRLAIMLGELISDIESLDNMDNERKKSIITKLRKTMIRVDIEEHADAVSKSRKMIKSNVRSAKSTSRNSGSDNNSDDEGMDII